jgi:hypothetical protein
MQQEKFNKLNQLFSQFNRETQASSFAVENLFNKVVKIMKEKETKNKIKKEND